MFPAARIGDPTTHDMIVPSGLIGPQAPAPCPMCAASPVMIEALPAAHVGCTAVCTGATSAGPIHPPPVPPAPPPPIMKGSLTVFIHNMPAARWAPAPDVAACTAFLGDPKLVAARTVLIGDLGVGAPGFVPGNAILNVTIGCGAEIFDEAKKANGGKDPNIVFGTPTSGFDAETDTSTGTITISSTSDKCTGTESVFFELANMAAKPQFDQIHADATAGKLSKEEYARANEKVEYENMKKTNAAIDKCKKKWGCDSHTFSFDGFRPAKDFDDYYDHYLAESHKNHYRNAWDTSFKAAYEAKHPPAAGP